MNKDRVKINLHQAVFCNDRGSAILISIIVLSLVTVVGIASIDTTTVEQKLVENERTYRQNFNMAEAAANEAGVILDLEEEKDELTPITTDKEWLTMPDPDDSSTEGFKGAATPEDSLFDDGSGTNPVSFVSDANGVVELTSLDVMSQRTYDFTLYGRSEANDGCVTIVMGYRKKF